MWKSFLITGKSAVFANDKGEEAISSNVIEIEGDEVIIETVAHQKTLRFCDYQLT